jgi:hypothetical protein
MTTCASRNAIQYRQELTRRLQAYNTLNKNEAAALDPTLRLNISIKK